MTDSSILLGFLNPSSQQRRTEVTAFCMQLRYYVPSVGSYFITEKAYVRGLAGGAFSIPLILLEIGKVGKDLMFNQFSLVLQYGMLKKLVTSISQCHKIEL